ncbi:hypothetical protein FRB99_000855 [Tulasnella sp. 403]|nr:hypothetical protein FRB99_000855 [Tulasnella sp. 403]
MRRGRTLTDLPDDVLEEVMWHAREWNCPPNVTEPREYPLSSDGLTVKRDGVVDEEAAVMPSSLVSLALTCRRLRGIAGPIILREVHVTSYNRLWALANFSREKLRRIRSLSLHLDVEFFAEFAQSLDRHFRTPHRVRFPRNRASTVYLLCHILTSAPLLQSFAIRLTKAASRPSAWKHFSFRSKGLSFKRAFEKSLGVIAVRRNKDKPINLGFIGSSDLFTHDTIPFGDLVRRVSWPRLTHIHLDALEDIGSLLLLSPNVSHLSLRMLEGFDVSSCLQFLIDVQLASYVRNRVPRYIAISARSLHLPHLEGTQARGVEFIEMLGQTCPGLEVLDLRVNAYSQDVLPYVPVYSRPSFSVRDS